MQTNRGSTAYCSISSPSEGVKLVRYLSDGAIMCTNPGASIVHSVYITSTQIVKLIFDIIIMTFSFIFFNISESVCFCVKWQNTYSKLGNNRTSLSLQKLFYIIFCFIYSLNLLYVHSLGFDGIEFSYSDLFKSIHLLSALLR